MKEFVSVLLLAGVLISSEVGFAKGANCILIDLDDTLIQSVGRAPKKESGERGEKVKAKLKCDPSRCSESLIRVGSAQYFVFPGAWELMSASLANPNYEVRIFSAGGEERNKLAVQRLLSLVATKGVSSEAAVPELLSKVKLFSREATLETEGQENKHFQPPSVPDPAGGVRKFFGHRKKDIQSVGCHLENSVLIDDNPTVSLRGQVSNLLTFPSDFDYRNYAESGFHFSTKEERFSYLHLYYVQGLLIRAAKRIDKKGFNLSQALFSLQYDGSLNEEGSFRVSPMVYDYRVYEEGFEALNGRGRIDWQHYPVGSTSEL